MRLLPILPLLVAALCLPAAAAGADPPGSQRAWGVGWDAGIAARYHLGEHWGLGLAVDPTWGDGDERRDDMSTSGVNMSQYDYATNSDHVGVSTSLMMFRETRLGRWVGIGPFARVAFGASRSRDEYARTRTSTGSPDMTSVQRTRQSRRDLWLDIGLRPVFHVEDRFVLETSLGVRVRRDHYDDTYTDTDATEVQSVSSRRSRDSTDWSVDVFGRDLGLAATMAFMIYL